jgi:NAD(P)-dependent dehydrogenase (short-subunit alcohol dehydrogenase family)
MQTRDGLEGKVALVTGGTSGLGRATAIAFAREGARVIVSGRDRQRGEAVVGEIRLAGGDAELVLGDLADPATPAALVRAAVDRWGRLDCAFNNASQLGAAAALAETTEEEFERVVATDLRSTWLCMKHEIRQMLEQDPPGGAIVNTASINALGGVPYSSLYAMVKAGIVALTKSAALETAKQDIRVNALVAGAFRTPMLESVFARLGGPEAEGQAQVEEKYREYIAAGRLGRPEEAAAVVVWLCSEASSYVTGHSMIVDGGMTAPFR